MAMPAWAAMVLSNSSSSQLYTELSNLFTTVMVPMISSFTRSGAQMRVFRSYPRALYLSNCGVPLISEINRGLRFSTTHVETLEGFIGSNAPSGDENSWPRRVVTRRDLDSGSYRII